MKVVRLLTGKGIDSLAFTDESIPDPASGEALVRLRAATLNFRDLIMAKGLLHGIAKEPDLIPLSCAAGQVIAVGDGVTRVKVGDRVTPIFALDSWQQLEEHPKFMLGGSVDGVAREFACFPAESLCQLPDQFSDLEGATFTCAALTAWSALTQFKALQPGDWILTHGTGGVSIAALQLAKAMGGRVAITSSSDVKLARARWLGADLCVNYRTTPDWAGAVREGLRGERIANVLDTVGVSHFDDNASLLSEGGQLSAIGMLAADFAWTRTDAPVTIAPIAVGNRDQHEAMVAFKLQHRIRPVVDTVFDFAHLADAYRCQEAGTFFGKVGVKIS